MKILLIGKNGQVGSSILKLNSIFQFDIFAYTRNQLDITNKNDILKTIKIIKPNVVINCSAYNYVQKAEIDEIEANKVNNYALENLSIICNNLNIPILHISTDFVFDGKKITPYFESDTVNPLNIYGISKSEGEIKIKKNTDRYIILRTSWVFSEIGDNFLIKILNATKTRKIISVVNDQCSSPTSAKGIANAILLIIKVYNETRILKWGTYHYTGYPYCSWFDFANQIITISRKYSKSIPDIILKPISTLQYNSQVNRPLNSCLDCSKIFQTFGISQDDWQSNLETILSNYFEK